jgi:hypothetical protein
MLGSVARGKDLIEECGLPFNVLVDFESELCWKGREEVEGAQRCHDVGMMYVYWI